MGRKRELQQQLCYFRDDTRKTHVSLNDIAECGTSKGWPSPKPRCLLDRSAQQLDLAVRDETRPDPTKGYMYSTDIALTTRTRNGQMTLRADAAKALRPFTRKSFAQRREQAVDDAEQPTSDLEHWTHIMSYSRCGWLPCDAGCRRNDKIQRTRLRKHRP